MKAVVITQHGDVDGLAYREVPELDCGPDDLLVRVRATALNRADILQRKGHYPPPRPSAEFEIPGLEFAGEVEAAGSRVTDFQVGDRVMGLTAAGGHAQKLVVPSRMAVEVPNELDWHQAASLPEVFITAHDALVTQCGLTSGETVLIHAAGSGVGIAAIQIARTLGTSFILGTAGSASKLARACELGLDFGINYNTDDFSQIVARVCGPEGVDVILDVVGAKYLEKNINSLRLKGRMVLVGLLGGALAQVNLAMLLSKRLTIRGTSLRSRPLEEKIAATRAFEKSVVPLIVHGRIQPIVDRVFPLSDIQEAHRYMESNANFGKIVLDVS
ncbi:MAG TPA: NAD(P)H-quinone oxidoreductase [Acidobacteriota bacterium]|nr:NAD(P)H-quinone oxidoreductase [Acidobacteriota bacterium]